VRDERTGSLALTEPAAGRNFDTPLPRARAEALQTPDHPDER
jgi:hypothetical protein